MNRFTHFELATTDLEKTAAFYLEVFGWQIQKWEGPVDYWLVMTGDASTPGINGGLMPSGGEFRGTIDTIEVDDIDALPQRDHAGLAALHCYPFADTPLVPDVGIVASTDPVAIDQASAGLVIAQPGHPLSQHTANLGPGEDKFRAAAPAVDWGIQLAHAERIGLGTRAYELARV